MKFRLRWLILSLIIVIMVTVSGLLIVKDQTTVASNQPSNNIQLGEQSQQVVVKFYYESREQLNSVAGSLDIWEVHPLPGVGPSAGYALAAVYPAQQDWLKVQGFRVEVDQEHTDRLQAPAVALDPRYYYFDYNNPNPNGLYIVEFLQQTAAIYPGITELIDIGDAWQTSHGGPARDMWVMRISNEDPAYGDIADKPPFFLFANIHAREVTTPEMAIRYIKYLTTGYLDAGGYSIDPDVTWLVNHHVVYVLVSQNPDGHVINEINWNAYWRKNADNDDGCATSYGVDLNRNSNFFWGCCGGSSGNCSSETYRGPARGSEPETAALQDFVSLVVFNDWNGPNGDDELPPAAPDNTSGLFISLHSYQDEILWSYEFDPGGAPNGAGLSTIGHKLADTTGVMYPSGFLYTVDGSTIDWVYGKLGVPGYTFEIGPTSGNCGDFFPSYDCQDGTNGASRNFWAEMKPAFLYANKIARTPYITSYGPDAADLVVTPAEVQAGIPVDLTGLILDQRYSGDPLTPVAGAEYFIDTEGADGTGIPMDPSDGAWGETSEPVDAVVDTSGLSMGQHYILVHGQNNLGQWGPFTAVFLTITEPQVPVAGFSSNSPVELGLPMLFTNLTIGSDPITYLWVFGDGVGTSTDENPSYTYQDVGTYTVTLTASNAYGDDTVTGSVEVIPPSIASVALSQVTPAPAFPGDVVQFSADLSPNNAGKPYTYTIDFGDGSSDTGTSSADPFTFSHVFAHAGIYTVSISVQNSSMTDPITSSVNVEISYRLFLPLSIK